MIRAFGSERQKFRYANRQIDKARSLLDYPVQRVETEREPVLEDLRSTSIIPNRIVQTFRSPNVIGPIQSAIMRWQEINPEFGYQYFDEDSCRKFIQRFYPENVLRAYDIVIPGAYKADLWRYCFLAKFGGVYADIRSEPVCALRTILSAHDRQPFSFVCTRDMEGKDLHGRAYLYNAFIAAVPAHPFIIAALERTVDNILNRKYGRDILDISGPACLGAAANIVLKRPIDSHFELGDHDHPAAGRYKILEQREDNFHRFIIADDDQPMIVTKCIHPDFKLLDARITEKRYSQYYNRRNVFRDTE